MNNLFLYLAQSGGCMLAFYLLYQIFLRNETSFQYNRFYLLFTPLVSLLIPFLEMPSWFSSRAIIYIAESSLNNAEIITSPGNIGLAQNKTVFEWIHLLYILYGLGFTLSAYRLLRQLFFISSFIKRNKANSSKEQGIIFIHTNGQLPTFSFLHYLFWDNSQPINTTDQQKIIQHESIHIYQKHSWDIIYLEILTIVFWFNPLFYLYKKALIATHEFIADAAVLRTCNQQEYTSLLMNQVFRNMEYTIGHFFNKSLTLKRMKMLQKNHLRANKLKLTLVLPLVALLLFLVSTKSNSVAEALESPFSFTNTYSSHQPTQVLQKGNNKVPQFPGGKAAFRNFLTQNTQYPASALKDKITGQVIIQATIDADGYVGNFKTLQSDNTLLEQEAMRVLKDMPRWQPAAKEGKAIAADVAFPFVFGLESNRNLPTLQIPQNRTQFILQDAFTVVGYDKLVGGKTVVQKSTLPTSKTNPKDLPVETHIVFTSAEKPAVFIGGEAEMHKFIRMNLKYPAEALRRRQEGTVVVEFIVDPEGKVYDAKVIKSAGFGLDEEALRVVNLMPNFEPSMQNSKPVAFKYTLPFQFNLASPDNSVVRAPVENAKVTPKPIDLANSDKVYTFVEQQASFPGGYEAMNKFMKDNLKYPESAKRNKKEGLVVVRFVVNKNGKISNPEVVKSLDKDLDEEALRVVNQMPDFTPATQGGIPVNFGYTLPIRFGL